MRRCTGGSPQGVPTEHDHRLFERGLCHASPRMQPRIAAVLSDNPVHWRGCNLRTMAAVVSSLFPTFSSLIPQGV